VGQSIGRMRSSDSTMDRSLCDTLPLPAAPARRGVGLGLFRRRDGPANVDEAFEPQGSAPDCGEYRETTGPLAEAPSSRDCTDGQPRGRVMATHKALIIVRPEKKPQRLVLLLGLPGFRKSNVAIVDAVCDDQMTAPVHQK
jgi:hypothetical protein